MSSSYLEAASPESIFDTWVLMHPSWRKFESDENNKLLFTTAQKYRWSLTALDRAFSEIKSQLQRVDGHDAEWDREQAKARREQAAQSLSPEQFADFERFCASISPSEVRRRWDSDPYFKIYYSRLMRERGYTLASASAPTQEVTDLGPYANLSRAEYNALPAATVHQLNKNPQFRAAVEKIFGAQ